MLQANNWDSYHIKSGREKEDLNMFFDKKIEMLKQKMGGKKKGHPWPSSSQWAAWEAAGNNGTPS